MYLDLTVRSEARVEVLVVVEARAVTRLPRLAEPRRLGVPVRTNLPGDGAQVTPEILGRRPAPVPVAVVDAVDDEPGLEHERVRHHRVVKGVGVLLDVEVLLDLAPGVGQEGPVRPDGGPELPGRGDVV